VKRIRIGALLSGLIQGLIAPALLGAVISLAIHFVYVTLTVHTMQQYVALRNGPVFWALSVAVVIVGVGSGGYVATRLSRTSELATAVVVGAVIALLQLALAVTRPGPEPWWVDAVFILSILPAAIAGGRLAAAAQQARPAGSGTL
jgi:hypothetical protein